MAHKVYTTKITLRNGRVLHAREVGKKCFIFWVKDKEDEDVNPKLPGMK